MKEELEVFKGPALTVVGAKSRVRRFILELQKRILVALLSVGIFMLSPGVQQFVVARTQALDYELATAQLSLLKSELEAFQNQLDPTQFDVEELSFELAFDDADTITRWVKDNIAFEQYPGFLRGPEGTLISNAGNALDQAALLKELLLAAGYEVEIARATLEPAQSRTLLLHMFNERPEAREAVEYSQTDLNDLLAGLGVENTQAKIDKALLEANQLEAESRADAEGQTQLILNALAAAGVTLGDPDIEAKLIAEAQDYFWVRYRQAASDGWQDAHLFEVWSLEPLETFTEDLPNELKHRFKLEAFIEKRVGEKLEVEPIMPAWEQTAASLVGKPINFTTMHTNLQSEEDFQNLGEILAGNGFFMPLLDGELAPNAQFFDLAGNVLPPAIAGDKIAELVQEGAGQLTGAADALGGLGGESPLESTVATELTAYWLTYTLINPNGESTVYKRSFFDRLGQANRDTNNLELAPRETIFGGVVGSQTFMLNTGKYSFGYVTQLGFERLEKIVPALAVIYETVNQGREDLTLEDLSDLLKDVKPMDHLELYGLFELEVPSGSIKSFRAEPSLLITHEIVNANRDGDAFSVDIVHNARRTLEYKDEKMATAVAESVQAGAWETRAELSFLESRFDDAQHNVYASWANTNLQSIKIISSTDDERLAELKTQEPVTDAMRLDLERGYHILVNSESPDTWWRIDTSTGEVLGIGPNGYGQVTVEHISLAHSVVFGGLGVMGCLQGGGNSLCCLAFGLLGIAFGLALGGAIAGQAVEGVALTGRQATAFFVGQQVDAGGIMIPLPCEE